MAKAKKKATKKKSVKKKAKPAEVSAPEMKGDPKLLELLQGLAQAVYRGDMIGIVVIPVNKNGTASEVIFRGDTPPSAMALPALALQQAVLVQATEAAQRQMAMQEALKEAKDRGLIKNSDG